MIDNRMKALEKYTFGLSLTEDEIRFLERDVYVVNDEFADSYDFISGIEIRNGRLIE